MTDTDHNLDSGTVTTPRGFTASGVRCGLKKKRPDLAVVASEYLATAAALFTTNTLRAAPIQLSQDHIRTGHAKAIVINSGNANACTGEQGLEDARTMARIAAGRISCSTEDILVASTGVIGHYLPMDIVTAGIQSGIASLSSKGGQDAARAIMTTDTVAKHVSARMDLNGHQVTIGAMAKGSGMIEPNMATMIGVVTTDAAISPERCDQALRSCCRSTLNALTIDGEMSTNDCVFLLANGASGMPMITERDEHYNRFCTLLQTVLAELSRKIAMDGEGASRAISVTVRNAYTTAQAEQAARAVANSLLVKTAVYGKDPNWGRVISAVGASGVPLNPEALSVQFAGIPVVLDGAACSYSRNEMDQALGDETITITVELGSGNASARIWTCDLTHDYITINAEYTT